MVGVSGPFRFFSWQNQWAEGGLIILLGLPLLAGWFLTLLGAVAWFVALAYSVLLQDRLYSV